MKVINPSTTHNNESQLQSGMYEACRSGKWKPDAVTSQKLLYNWDQNIQKYALSVTVRGTEFQVVVCNSRDQSTVIADIDGTFAEMNTWQEKGTFGKRDRARLYFADKEFASFSDTRELPTAVRGLGDAMLEALAQATQICLDAQKALVAAKIANEEKRRAAAIADIKNL